MTSSLPKTTQSTNPTPRIKSTIRCFKCRKVGHVKANCSKVAIVMDDPNPLPTNDSKKFELDDEIYDLDKAISLKHVHIIHDIILKEFASLYERYKTFIAFPRRYKILKQSDLVDTKIHPPKLLKISFKFQLKNYVPFKILLKIYYNTYILDILNYWGISTSFTTLDLVEFHENDIPIENFSSPHPLESEFLPNSFLSPPLVSNVGLIDKIIDHRTINTDSKEDDYKFLIQWKGNTISDASWITSHGPLHYAPRLHSDLFSYMKDTSSEMKSSNPVGMMENYFKT